MSSRWDIFKGQPGEGWQDWPGGPRPQDRGEVDVRWRSGHEILYRSWDSIAGNWEHDGSRRDIVAFRPHPKEVFECPPGMDPEADIPF